MSRVGLPQIAEDKDEEKDEVYSCAHRPSKQSTGSNPARSGFPFNPTKFGMAGSGSFVGNALPSPLNGRNHNLNPSGWRESMKIAVTTSRTMNLQDIPSIKTEEEKETWKDKVDTCLSDNLYWLFIVMVLTLWALYIDDFNVIALDTSWDEAIYIVNWCILSVFLIEFCLCCVVQRGYSISWQSLMDCLAVLSLVPFNQVAKELGLIGNDLSVARVARAARALRILRATRAAAMALRAKKQMAQITTKRRKKKMKAGTSVLEDTLVQRTNIKVLAGILVLLIGTTLMDVTATDRLPESGLILLNSASTFCDANITSVYKEQVEADGWTELMHLSIHGTVYLDKDTSSLRADEVMVISLDDGSATVVVSLKQLRVTQAGFSMGVTTFAAFVILVWTASFGRDHRKYVLEPVNRMITKLREMSEDPRIAMEMHMNTKSLRHKDATEMEEIELSVGRLGQLIKVGFGEAGMNVISKNIGGRDFDPLVPGCIVLGVFGFCDIRNFTDCCEVLGADTMVFTNSVAQIVHEEVESSGGGVNKNIGDAFLAVWKLAMDDEHLPVSALSKSHKYSLTRATVSAQPRDAIVDASVRAFINIHSQLEKDASIQEFCQDSRLQERLPGYKVRMGYGLHLGWAIEGAVGSRYKVDATYLSPNVNMASRLEAATKQYGVKLLMSDPLVSEMGEELKKECRCIDWVTVKGSKQPIGLYVHMPTEHPQLDDIQMWEFIATWRIAFELYRDGSNWAEAVRLMRHCLRIAEDGPAAVLLGLMNEHNCQAPSDWEGFHALTSK